MQHPSFQIVTGLWYLLQGNILILKGMAGLPQKKFIENPGLFF